MGLRHVAAATILTLACATLVAPPAQAQPEGDRVARDGDHFPVTISTDVPAGGTSMVTSPTIGKDVKKLTVTAQPKNNHAGETATYDHFTHSMGTMAKGKRLLVCTMLYQSIVFHQDSVTDEFELDGLFATLALAVMVACLHMAGLLDGNGRTSNQARSSGAGQKCGQIRPSVPATVKKVSGGYSFQASGPSKKAKKPKLKFKCRVTGHKVTYTMRPAKKGMSLRKAIGGKKVMVGMKSPDDAATSVPVKVTFATP